MGEIGGPFELLARTSRNASYPRGIIVRTVTVPSFQVLSGRPLYWKETDCYRPPSTARLAFLLGAKSTRYEFLLLKRPLIKARSIPKKYPPFG